MNKNNFSSSTDRWLIRGVAALFALISLLFMGVVMVRTILLQESLKTHFHHEAEKTALREADGLAARLHEHFNNLKFLENVDDYLSPISIKENF